MAAEQAISPAKHFREARFHLSYGAHIERINTLADNSANGLQQSYGLAVNYRYDLDAIELNLEVYSREGVVSTPGAVRRSGHLSWNQVFFVSCPKNQR